MPPKQKVHCSPCDLKHQRPVGRNCKRNTGTVETGNAHSIVEPSLPNLAAPVTPADTQSTAASSTQSVPNLQMFDKVLETLGGISQQISAIDRRVQQNERAIAGQSDSPAASSLQSPSVPTGPNVAIGRPVSSQVVAPDQSIVPSLQFLQTDSMIQSQVDNRMVAINHLGDQRLHPGKLVSQRGGGGRGSPCTN